jgi:formamidopyrimidine-DNA glycosylase
LPELPEVETVLRSIALHIVGHTIQHADFYSTRVTRGGLAATSRAVAGAAIRGARRRGKQIFVDLDHGTLYVHLGMTGKLLWNGESTKYTRAVFELDNGTLLYDDTRQFGRVEFYKSVPDALDRVGPDALTLGFEEFYARLQQHRRKIKPLLLDQSFISGVGNIYADELLFAASIHPRALASRISRKRAEHIHKQLLEVLQSAIDHRGSSISDYVDASGERGRFQTLHNVYGREGEPCPRCGGPIRRIVLGQRGTHYCPHCQRA